MQILKIINIQKILKGGSTKPLLITALNSSNKEIPYVMKIYKKENVEENYTIAKEILISELAKKFDLPVPEYGLVQINDTQLSKFYTSEEINSLDNGYKFCTEYREGALIANNELNRKYLDNYDYSKLFAFDALIMNSDRGGFNKKPNLLFTDSQMLLIDHELSLPFYSSLNKNETNYYNLFNVFYCKNHIFWNSLKNLPKKDKVHIFEEFLEILRTINFDFLNIIFENFDKYGISHGNKDVIFSYLYWAKNNLLHIQRTLNQKLNDR